MKTTLLGILTIIATLSGAAVDFLKTGSFNIAAVTVGMSTGIGLINAKDATAK